MQKVRKPLPLPLYVGGALAVHLVVAGAMSVAPGAYDATRRAASWARHKMDDLEKSSNFDLRRLRLLEDTQRNHNSPRFSLLDFALRGSCIDEQEQGRPCDESALLRIAHEDQARLRRNIQVTGSIRTAVYQTFNRDHYSYVAIPASISSFVRNHAGACAGYGIYLPLQLHEAGYRNQAFIHHLGYHIEPVVREAGAYYGLGSGRQLEAGQTPSPVSNLVEDYAIAHGFANSFRIVARHLINRSAASHNQTLRRESLLRSGLSSRHIEFEIQRAEALARPIGFAIRVDAQVLVQYAPVPLFRSDGISPPIFGSPAFQRAIQSGSAPANLQAHNALGAASAAVPSPQTTREKPPEDLLGSLHLPNLEGYRDDYEIPAYPCDRAVVERYEALMPEESSYDLSEAERRRMFARRAELTSLRERACQDAHTEALVDSIDRLWLIPRPTGLREQIVRLAMIAENAQHAELGFRRSGRQYVADVVAQERQRAIREANALLAGSTPSQFAQRLAQMDLQDHDIMRMIFLGQRFEDTLFEYASSIAGRDPDSPLVLHSLSALMANPATRERSIHLADGLSRADQIELAYLLQAARVPLIQQHTQIEHLVPLQDIIYQSVDFEPLPAVRRNQDPRPSSFASVRRAYERFSGAWDRDTRCDGTLPDDFEPVRIRVENALAQEGMTPDWLADFVMNRTSLEGDTFGSYIRECLYLDSDHLSGHLAFEDIADINYLRAVGKWLDTLPRTPYFSDHGRVGWAQQVRDAIAPQLDLINRIR